MVEECGSRSHKKLEGSQRRDRDGGQGPQGMGHKNISHHNGRLIAEGQSLKVPHVLSHAPATITGRSEG